MKDKIKDIKFKIIMSILIMFFAGFLLGLYFGVNIVPQKVVTLITSCP